MFANDFIVPPEFITLPEGERAAGFGIDSRSSNHILISDVFE